MYDLAILGGGPAGYTAAAKALKHGMNVVIFEGDNIGGVCLNAGCIPTKTLLYGSKIYRHITEAAKYGVNASDVNYDYNAMLKRKERVIRRLVAGVKQQIKGATMVCGTARVANYREHITTIVCNDEHYEARNLLIATGSVNASPKLEGITSEHVVDSTATLNMSRVPKNAVIIGGGVIGMEFAQLWSNLGSKVTIVEALPTVLANFDEDISNYISQTFSKRGVKIMTSTRVESITGQGVMTSAGEISGDTVLVCTGRRPNMTGTEILNLPLTGKGISVDSHMRTALPGVYAAGDVTGISMLAHSAERQAAVAVNDMMCIEDEMRYNAIPAVVYCDPEIAAVGLTERQAKEILGENNYNIETLPMLFSGRFVAENDGEQGLCKVITDKHGIIIGTHMVGNPASEIIAIAVMAIEQGMTTEQLSRIILPHPTVGEILKHF